MTAAIDSTNDREPVTKIEETRSLLEGIARPWRPEDAPVLASLVNNRAIWRNVRDLLPHPYTLADAEAFLAKQTDDPPVNFAILHEGDVAGGIGLTLGTDVYRRSAEIGYWVAQSHWGKGLATTAVRAVTAYAFTTFDLLRIQAGVYAWNPASRRVLEKAGYRLECVRQHGIFKDGQVTDEFVLVTFRDS